jgi:adenosylhomocysteine nucleosidase
MSQRRALIVTPIQEEYDDLCSSLTNLGLNLQNDRIGKLDVCQFPELRITVAPGGHGKTQFGIQTQYLLDQVKYDLVLCVGAAGALAPEVRVGDLIVATVTFEHDYNLKFVRRPKPRFMGDMKSIEQIKHLKLEDWKFNIHFGIMASGDEDVIDVTRGRELRKMTNALGVAWEGVGGARACAFNGVPFLELRGATDTANHAAPVIFDRNLKIVMNHISLLLTAWLC